jgi:LysM repeat protein
MTTIDTPGVQIMPQTATMTITHIVQPGETLSKIALKYYGNMNNYPTIANANNIVAPFTINVGQKLKIPNVPEHNIDVDEVQVTAQRLPDPQTASVPARPAAPPAIAAQGWPTWLQDWRVWVGGALVIGGLLYLMSNGRKR